MTFYTFLINVLYTNYFMNVYVKFYNIKCSLDSEMSKERLYTVHKLSLYNYISRTFRLNFIILNSEMSNEFFTFTV